MQKYEQFKKISKTQNCSFYKAINKQTRKSVLIKRLHHNQSWNHLLSNKNLIYSNKQKMFLKNVEIFKRKNSFFIVTQLPNGPPLTKPQLSSKIQPHRFYSILSDFLENLNQLLKFQPSAYIQLDWLFIHHNSIKIGHFQPFFNGQKDPHEHVFMFNLQKGQLSEYISNQKTNFAKNQNIMFKIGFISYNLLTGRPLITAQTQQEYSKQVQALNQKAQRILSRQCKDEKLKQIVIKMLSKDPSQIPTMQQLKNFTTRKIKDIQSNQKKVDSSSVQFQIQKIQLNKNKMKLKSKNKFIRPCCKTFQDEVQDQQHKNHIKSVKTTRKNVDLKTDFNHFDVQLVSPKAKTRNKSVLPFISTKINQDYLKRNSIFFPTNLNKPLMFKNDNKKYNKDF